MISASKAARQAKRAAAAEGGDSKKKTPTSRLSSKANSKAASKASSVSGDGDDAENGGTSSKKMGDVKKLADQVDKFGLSDRVTTGVLASLPASKDVKITSTSLVFHGRVLITDTTLELNYGRRYGLLGENGCGKSTFLKAIDQREFPIPDHVDIYLLNEGAPPSDLGALEWVVREAEREMERLDNLAEEILEKDGPESPILDDIYEVSFLLLLLLLLLAMVMLTFALENGNDGSLDFPDSCVSYSYRSRFQQGYHSQEDKGYVWWMEDACCSRKGPLRQAFAAAAG